ncbi:MAG: hypothetical protein VCA36_08245 [Opitutales bacterium]
MKNKEECRLNSLTWGRVNGQVKEVKEENREETHDTCSVTLKAFVVPLEDPDPSFDFSLKLNRQIFRPGEKLEVTITPTAPMYITLFQWLPYVRGEPNVLRIFPNEKDGGGLFKGVLKIPNPEKEYSLHVEFPAEGMKEATETQEFIMAVATKKPTVFLDAYKLEAFERKLGELTPKNHRLKRGGYQVIKGQ